MLVARGMGGDTFILKEFITFGPVEVGVGDFPLIFIGGGTNTVLTWTGLEGGEASAEASEEAGWGMKVENCFGVAERGPGLALA